MSSSPGPSPDAPPPHDRRWTAAVFAAALTLYGLTLCPTIFTQDAAELTTVAATWGVAHPPGYSLFTLLYGALTTAVPFGDVALRTNAITALIAATTIAVLYRGARSLGASPPAAAAGALGVAVARDWWSQAVATEVYALDGLLVACAFLTTVRVTREPTGTRAWVWMGLAYGLASGHRSVNVVYLLPLLVWVESSRRTAGASRMGYGRFFAAGALTSLAWLYLPIAAAANPPMNAGDPSSPAALWEVISAAAYARYFASGGWQEIFARATHALSAITVQLGVTGLAAAIGLVFLRRAAAWAIAFVALLNVAFIALYDVPDGTSFLQPTWVVAAVLAALGYDTLRRLAPRAGAVAVIVVALVPATWTYARIDLSGVRTVDVLGTDLLACTTPGSLVLTYDDTARNAMLYHQVVHGRVQDVAVVDASASLGWHLRETRRRAPGFESGDASGDGWIELLARDLARTGTRGLYTTDPPDGPELERMLGPDLARGAVVVPTGLLYRVIVPSDPSTARELAARMTAEADAAFWTRHEIPTSPRARAHPQLALVTLRAAQARFLLAATYLADGRVDAAVPHLTAVAATDIDDLEDVVIEHFALAGEAPQRQRRAARCERALRAIRTGLPAADVLRLLSAR